MSLGNGVSGQTFPIKIDRKSLSPYWYSVESPMGIRCTPYRLYKYMFISDSVFPHHEPFPALNIFRRLSHHIPTRLTAISWQLDPRAILLSIFGLPNLANGLSTHLNHLRAVFSRRCEPRFLSGIDFAAAMLALYVFILVRHPVTVMAQMTSGPFTVLQLIGKLNMLGFIWKRRFFIKKIELTY